MKKVLKRVSSVVLSLLLILTLIPTVYAGTGTFAFKVSDVSCDATAGTSVSVPITLTSNPGITNGSITVSFPKGQLELTGVTDGGIIGGWMAPGAGDISAANESGSITLGWFDLMATSDHTGTGVLATMAFTVKSGATVGQKTLSVSANSGDFGDTSAPGTNTITPVGTAGSVTLTKDIDTIGVTVTAPAKNGDRALAADVTPSEGIQVESIAWYVGTTPFTGATYAGDTTYKAEITVSAVSGYNVSDTPTYQINSSSEGVTGQKSGDTWVLTKTFPETEGKELQSVAIKTGPNTTTYTYGQDFDPTGLTLTATFDTGDETVTSDNCEFTPTTLNTVGDTVAITVSYTYAGVTRTTTTNVKVNPKSVSGLTVESIAAQTYTGSQITPAVVVKDGTTTLTKDTDYTVSYGANITAGNNAGSVTITGKGNYDSETSKTVYFTINKAEVDVTAFPWENTYTFDYDGTNKTVALATYSDLVNAPAYENNVEKYVGTYEASAKFTLKDTANYAFKNNVDTTTQSWSILPVAQPATLSKNVATVTINKTVSIAGLINDLSEGATVQYAVTSGGGSVNNSGIYTAPGTAGTATVSVNVLAHNVDGKGDAEYTAKDLGTVTITVNTKHVDTTTMSVTMADYTYGDSTTPDPNPTGKPASTTDLEYLYTGTKTIGGSYSSDKKPIDAGSYAVKVSCEDDENVYEATANFTVASKSLSAATVDAIDDQTYTGSVIEPTVTVKDGTTTLTLDTDYTVAYATNHTNVADSPVAVTITGKGNYTGSPSAAVSFKIIKAQVTKPSLATDTSLTYNGSTQTRPNPSGFDSNTMTITGNTGTNAGDYTAVISLKDSDNYEWADGTTAALNAPFTIAKLAKALPTAGTNSFVYNGKDQTYAPAGYDSTLMKFKVTDSETKKNVGDYSVVVELKDTDNYKWAGDAADPTLEFHITAKELTFTASGSRDYDGTTVVSPTTLMTVTLSGMVNNESVAAPAVTSVGNTSKADAGTYDVTVTVGALSDGNYTLKSNTISNGQFTINPIPAGSAPVAEDAGVTVTENKAPVEDTSKKTTTYDLKVQNDGSSDTATVVLAYPTGMTKADAAKYNFVLKDASGNTVTFSGAMAAGLAFELPASAGGTSGEYTLTWTAKSTSSGKFLGEPGTSSSSSTSSGGDMNVPTTLTGINKVTVDGKTVPSKYYTVSGSTVVLSEEYMKTLSNGKHVIKAENATHVYTVSINVNNAAVKSAGTGDVGIALYAMLALSSATGAVWVSRKKKED